MADDYPDFVSAQFLRQHTRTILDFYEPRVLAREGGFYQCFLDDGTCIEPATRQLVGSARYVFNYASAYRIHGNSHYREWAEHGLAHLNTVHRQAEGQYVWLIDNGQISDSKIMAYGHAFVVLAASACVRAGIDSATQTLTDTWEFLELYFWDRNSQAYADERDLTLKTLEPYRGQNANMHMCEAALAAWQATSQIHFLDRAEVLAQRFTFELAQSASSEKTDGLVWEHYDSDWQVDMQFNIDKPNDRYKPWGYQPGHQTEWAKLLLMLHAERPDKKWLVKAQELFDRGIKTGWDDKHGGLVYSIAPDGRFCATEKYFWVHAEAIAAAWRLYKSSRNDKYLNDYHRIWRWSWKYLVDHQYGAWYQVRHRDGSPINDVKSPLGKTDYHTLGACWDVLENL